MASITAPLPSRFLDLPAELRNKIYDCVFTSRPHITNLSCQRPSREQTTWKTTLSRGNNLSLLLVCRQIHTEACMLAFSLSTFIVAPRTLGTKYELSMRSPRLSQRLAHITSVAWLCDCRYETSRAVRLKMVGRQVLIRCLGRATIDGVCMARFPGLESLRRVTLLFPNVNENAYLKTAVEECAVGDVERVFEPSWEQEVRIGGREAWLELGMRVERQVEDDVVEEGKREGDWKGFVLRWGEERGEERVERMLEVGPRYLVHY